MLIRMLKSTLASRDGLKSEDFRAGEVYTMATAHELRVAASLIKSGWAEEVGEKPSAPATEAKEPAPAASDPADAAQLVAERQPPAGGHTIKSMGFGKYRVVDAEGKPVAGPMPKAAAEAEAARLNGEG